MTIPRMVRKEQLMSTEWLMSVRDIEIAADVEREIEENKSDGGSSGRPLRINYATGLVIENVKPLLEASEDVQQDIASASS
jgi:hypothetical protein